MKHKSTKKYNHMYGCGVMAWDRQMHRQTDRQTDRWTYRCKDGRTNKKSNMRSSNIFEVYISQPILLFFFQTTMIEFGCLNLMSQKSV